MADIGIAHGMVGVVSGIAPAMVGTAILWQAH